MLPSSPRPHLKDVLTDRSGFTLIEILVVITIIGVLAGLLLPAVMKAVSTAQEGAYKLEIDTLADAVEKYKNKYGDYPPDGSSWQIMERHLRKAFPQILQTELNLLDPALYASQGWSGDPWNVNSNIIAGIRNDFDQSVVTPTYAAADLKVMDPAEALVFFLGGFSARPSKTVYRRWWAICPDQRPQPDTAVQRAAHELVFRIQIEPAVAHSSGSPDQWRGDQYQQRRRRIPRLRCRSRFAPRLSEPR